MEHGSAVKLQQVVWRRRRSPPSGVFALIFDFYVIVTDFLTSVMS